MRLPDIFNRQFNRQHLHIPPHWRRVLIIICAAMFGVFSIAGLALYFGGPPVAERFARTTLAAMGFGPVDVKIAEITPRKLTLRHFALGGTKDHPDIEIHDAQIGYDVPRLLRGKLNSITAENLQARARIKDGKIKSPPLEKLIDALSSTDTGKPLPTLPLVEIKRSALFIETSAGMLTLALAVSLSPGENTDVKLDINGTLSGKEGSQKLDCKAEATLSAQGDIEGKILVSPGALVLERAAVSIRKASVEFTGRDMKLNRIAATFDLSDIVYEDNKVQGFRLDANSDASSSLYPIAIESEVHSFAHKDFTFESIALAASLNSDDKGLRLSIAKPLHAKLSIPDPLGPGRSRKLLLSLAITSPKEDISFLNLRRARENTNSLLIDWAASFALDGGRRISVRGTSQGKAIWSGASQILEDLQVKALHIGSLIARDDAKPAHRYRLDNATLTIAKTTTGFAGQGASALNIAEESAKTSLLSARVKGTVQIAGAAMQLRGTLHDLRGKNVGAWNGTYNSDTKRGELALKTGDTKLGKNDVDLLGIAPALASYVKTPQGQASIAALLTWSPSASTSGARIHLADLSLATDQISTSGLNGDITFTSLAPLTTAGPQKISIGHLNIGLPLENGIFDGGFDERGRLFINQLQFPFSKGHIGFEPTVIEMAQPRLPFILNVENVDLGALVDSFEFDGLSGTGTVGGKLPLESRDGKIFVKDGILETKDGGILRYQSKTADAARKASQQSDLLFHALEDFHYDRLTLHLDGELTGELKARIALEGANPSLYEGQRVKLNVNVESPFAALWHQGITATQGTAVLDAIRMEYEKGEPEITKPERMNNKE